MLKFLSSKPLTLAILWSLCPLLALSTLITDNKAYLLPIIYTLLGLLAVMIAACTLHNWKRLSVAVLLIHAGCVITLGGGLLSAAGHVSTVNIYEGGSTNSVFRWDIEQNITLPFEIGVQKIGQEYYPVDVKIGVLSKGIRQQLIKTKTGDSFQINGYTVQVVELDKNHRTVMLMVLPSEGEAFKYITSPSDAALDEHAPIAFQLVAFKNPSLKKIWANLTFSRNDRVVFSGQTAINTPLSWNGLKFFITASSQDPAGHQFAGLQIVKDQGVYASFAGFGILCAGLALLLSKKY